MTFAQVHALIEADDQAHGRAKNGSQGHDFSAPMGTIEDLMRMRAITPGGVT